jgi:Fic family protein
MQDLQLLYDSIDSKKIKLDAFRPFSAKQAQKFKTLYLLDMTYHSNALEGNSLNAKETKKILEEGTAIGGKLVSEHIEVINHREAIEFVDEQLNRPLHGLDENDILALHRLLLTGVNTKEAGCYRTQHVAKRKSNGDIYHFVSPNKIQKEIEKFLKWFGTATQLHPIALASQTHNRFATIHPFSDANGRISRLLMNLILMHHGYPPAIIHLQDQSEYIHAIENAQNNNLATTFDRFITQKLNHNIDFYLESLEQNTLYT